MSESVWMSSFDAATGMVTLPWWAAAAIVAFLVVAVVLAMVRGGPAILVGGVVGVALLAGVATVATLESARLGERERVDERRMLLTRAQDLSNQAAAPGSALACLDGAIGETVEAGCERALFASPEAVAGATAHTAARLALLAEAVIFAAQAKRSDDDTIVPGLRGALESDPFGFVAQVLASRHGCSVENCRAFALFRDPTRITNNLKEHTYETYVTRHAAGWQSRNNRAPVASSGGASPIPPGFNVPSAASIPPVSIMVPEQTTSSAPAEAAAASPPRRPSPPRTARPTGTPPVSPNPPQQIVPPAATAPPQATGSTPRPQ